LGEAPSARQQADGLIERSKSLCEIGRWKDAEVQARRAMEADPTYARAGLQLAHVLLTLGRRDEAAGFAKRALSQEPASSWAMRILGAWHGAHGRHAEAVTLAEQAVAASQGDPVSLLYLSHAKQDAGDLSGARIAAERLVAHYPDWPDSFVRLAQTRHSPEEAVRAYREALRLDPQSDAALAGLAGMSGSLAQYHDSVSLAWSALRSDVTDKARQRLFARSAWVYLALSRIIRPTRSTQAALAGPFGEACAYAFFATGSTAAARLRFAFRGELCVLGGWMALALAFFGAAFLPAALADVLVPLLGIPVFLGAFIPLVLFFRVIAAARRLLDFRITQRLGRGGVPSLVLRAMLSGFFLMAIALAALLAWPTRPAPSGWLFMAGALLAIQDLVRWRDQWRDSVQTVDGRTPRQVMADAARAWAERTLTPIRLLAFVIAATAADVVVRGVKSLDPSDPSPAAVVALAALCALGLDFGARRVAASCAAVARAQRWRAFGRAWLDVAWLTALAVALVAVGGRAVEGQAVEALYPLVMLPLVIAGGWLLLRAAHATIVLLGGEASAFASRARG
jgi:tetratricopeptide (TPR) repeat protein